MLQDYSRAIDQIGDPAFRGVLIRGVGLTLVVFVAVAILAWYLLSLVPEFQSDWWSWVNYLVDIGGGLGIVVLMALLFPAIVTMFMSMFLDDIAEAVERKHYPADSPGRELPFGPALWLSLKFAGIVILLNLWILPLYVLTFIFPPISLVLFYGLNGYLLSREYFELVAWRHVDKTTARRLRKANQGRLWLVGAFIAFMLTIPIVNIIWPLVATAAMVHCFKRIQRRSAA